MTVFRYMSWALEFVMADQALTVKTIWKPADRNGFTTSGSKRFGKRLKIFLSLRVDCFPPRVGLHDGQALLCGVLRCGAVRCFRHLDCLLSRRARRVRAPFCAVCRLLIACWTVARLDIIFCFRRRDETIVYNTWVVVCVGCCMLENVRARLGTASRCARSISAPHAFC